MTAGKQADFGAERADLLVAPPVATDLLVENADAEGLLLQVVECLADLELRGLGKGLEDGGADFLLERLDSLLPGDLARSVESRFDAVAGDAVGDFEKLVGHDEECCLALWLAGSEQSIPSARDQLTYLVVRESESRDEVGFGHFLRLAFDHDHVVFGSHVDEIEVARAPLTVNRIRHELAVDAADAHRADRPGKRDVGNTECGARAIDEEDVGIVFAVRAEEQCR